MNKSIFFIQKKFIQKELFLLGFREKISIFLIFLLCINCILQVSIMHFASLYYIPDLRNILKTTLKLLYARPPEHTQNDPLYLLYAQPREHTQSTPLKHPS